MADLELNSIGNGDGNNYLLRDNSKIPLTGTNALAGSIVPSTDNTYDLGSSSKKINKIWVNETRTTEVNHLNDTSYLSICGGTTYHHGAQLVLAGMDDTNRKGEFLIRAYNSTNGEKVLEGKPDGTLSWSGLRISATRDDLELNIDGGSGYANGATLWLTGKNASNTGTFGLLAHNGTVSKMLRGHPDGSLTWNGTAIQTTSDQRLKQQISEIDDDLLTAWEDVSLVQFKYNDAVEEKSDNARLHTGYVVQQIDEACKKHNIDVSKYGLYCHEEYAEETREVEQADGTKKTEVVRPANEHYSLRYTEALIVECAYLRRENSRLKERLSKIEKLLNI